MARFAVGRFRARKTWTAVGFLQLANVAALALFAASGGFRGSAESHQATAAMSHVETESSISDRQVAPLTAESASQGPTPGLTQSIAARSAELNAQGSTPRYAAPNLDSIARPTAPEPGDANASADRVARGEGDFAPLAPEPTDGVALDRSVSLDAVESIARPSTSVSPPVLANPPGGRVSLRCMVNGELVELAPGERRQLSGGDMWIVRFHRGGKFGIATEPLYDGVHRFVVGQEGWRLERVPDDITTDRPR